MFSWITLLTQWPLWLNQNLHHSLICDVSAQTCRHTQTQWVLQSTQPHSPGVQTESLLSRNVPGQTAGAVRSALLLCWQFAAKLACWLLVCCIVFMQGGDWAKAFWHAWVPSFVSFCPSGWNAVKKRAGELEDGWKEFELLSLSVIQADFFAKMALDQELTVLKGKTATPS